jgi:hypothetical protein
MQHQEMQVVDSVVSHRLSLCGYKDNYSFPNTSISIEEKSVSMVKYRLIAQQAMAVFVIIYTFACN